MQRWATGFSAAALTVSLALGAPIDAAAQGAAGKPPVGRAVQKQTRPAPPAEPSAISFAIDPAQSLEDQLRQQPIPAEQAQGLAAAVQSVLADKPLTSGQSVRLALTAPKGGVRQVQTFQLYCFTGLVLEIERDPAGSFVATRGVPAPAAPAETAAAPAPKAPPPGAQRLDITYAGAESAQRRAAEAQRAAETQRNGAAAALPADIAAKLSGSSPEAFKPQVSEIAAAPAQRQEARAAAPAANPERSPSASPDAEIPASGDPESDRRLKAPAGAALAAPSAPTLPSIAPGTIVVRRLPASGDALATLSRAGMPTKAVAEAAAALAGATPASLNTAQATFEVVGARGFDGEARIVSVSAYSGSLRAQAWWFSPKDQPEGWFDNNGRRLGESPLAQPVADSRISSPFGMRGPTARSKRFHNGVDIEGKWGTPIYAAADGVVELANWYFNYGRTIILRHSDSMQTLYAHTSKFAPGVSPGQRVRKGDLIAYVGSTGRSTGPHLHFSVIVDGAFVNPASWLSGGEGMQLDGQDLVSFRQWQRGLQQALPKDPGRTAFRGYADRL